MDMITVPLPEIQEQIRDNCPEELATVIMRRFMMRAAERIARERECSALITGESLGQVASQTIQAIACTDAAANMPVFRPLIGSDKSEIVTLAHRIDTYDISIEPYEDCCTVFTPKHPRTRPTLNVVEAAEQKLDVEQLLKNCLERRRSVICKKGEFYHAGRSIIGRYRAFARPDREHGHNNRCKGAFRARH